MVIWRPSRLLVEAGADVNGKGDDYEVGVLGWATCFRQVREDVAAYLLVAWRDSSTFGPRSRSIAWTRLAR